MTFDLNNLVITVDKDVPMKKGRSRGVDMNDPNVQKLKSMDIGDSFWLGQGTSKADARSVINLGKKISVFLEARYVEVDEIEQVAGTRVWRINESDVRTRGKPQARSVTDTTVRYWHHPESSCVLTTVGDEDPGDPLCEEVDKATYDRLKVEYEEDF